MKVITAVVNNPIFIEIQYHTLKKFLNCDYEFIVFNDSKDFPDYSNGGDINIKNQIETLCKTLDIICINIPNDNHIVNQDAAIRCADSMNFILNYQKNNPDEYLLLDSDMFLIDNFDMNEYKKYDCAVVLQSRNNLKINYIWNGIYYFNFNKMKNINKLNWNCSPGCDVGGMMQEWLSLETDSLPDTNLLRYSEKNEKFTNNNIYFIRHLWSCTWDEYDLPDNLKNNQDIINFLKDDIRNVNGKFFCEIYDNKFLHYRAGGNWERKNINIHIYLSNKLKETLKKN